MTVYVVEILCYDGGGFEGVFSTHAKAQAWIDEQPKHKFMSWEVVPVELDVPVPDPSREFSKKKKALVEGGHVFKGIPQLCVGCQVSLAILVAQGEPIICPKKEA